jgi:alkylation response protein AidB-like acyl-CoA dehydrogenase
MTFMLTEEQAMVRESARQVASAISVRATRDLLSPQNLAPYSEELLRQSGETGLGGVLVPEEFGGVSLGVVTTALVARELGRNLVVSPLLGASVAADILARHAAPALASHWLPQLASGPAVIALALEKHDAPAVTLSSSGRVDGQCDWAVDAASANAILVAARTADGPTLLFMPADLAGIATRSQRLADGRLFTSITFDNVELPSDGNLGKNALDEAFMLACVWISAASCGVVEEAFQRTVEYLRQRRQFERSLASFQALQHKLAQMHCDIEDAWSATHLAASALDRKDARAAFHVAVAKAKSSDVASTHVAECLQLHGGIGMTDEHDIGLFLKAARVLSEQLGGFSYHADKVARELGY